MCLVLPLPNSLKRDGCLLPKAAHHNFPFFCFCFCFFVLSSLQYPTQGILSVLNSAVDPLNPFPHADRARQHLYPPSVSTKKSQSEELMTPSRQVWEKKGGICRKLQAPPQKASNCSSTHRFTLQLSTQSHPIAPAPSLPPSPSPSLSLHVSSSCR
jgi:hypothetical protein